ncbi:flagellar biosynthetic protein FliO [Paenibacillus sp. GCM10012307]|uniref:Flagellar biosynthetic protein FliO n=1 Tax=Paenibacillus roseus TaxID=2798579 RepID=A0A934J4Z6_9BACL|nr:flagellar biosynthetic protein FliO [Paenibacillus roseus]MBJ6363389.1 flagellar biosynthetic protein FliO [Paenibacillus roseus]
MQPDDNLLGNLVWVIIALLLVIGLIVIFIKFLSQRSRGYGMNRSVRTLGGVALGQNKSLQIVELAGKVYVVGVGDDVTLLDKIDSPEEARIVIDKMEAQLGGGNLSVAEWIRKYRKRNEGSDIPEESWSSRSVSFESMLQDKLQRQTERKRQIQETLNHANPMNQSRDE